MEDDLQSWRAMVSAAAAALPAFLQQQRWYPAKQSGTAKVTPGTLVPLASESTSAAIVLWEVTPPTGDSLQLFVPLASVPNSQSNPAHVVMHVGEYDLVEAFGLDSFVRAWVKLHFSADVGGLSQSLRNGSDGRPADGAPDLQGNMPVRRSGAQQSNTSIRAGKRAILKVFRKLERGTNPELEVGRYLTQAGFRAMPQILAWMDAVHDGIGCTLSILQTFVPNEGDGWTRVLAKLTGAFKENQPEDLTQSVRWLQTLGRRTAEMHRLFAADTDDPAFQPEQVGAADLRAWAENSAAMAERAFQSLEGDDPTPQQAAAVLAQRGAIQSILSEVRHLPTLFTKTRSHGDFHLGQTLVVGDDAFILDFEGEPLRPLAERRAKHCILRDVAGMLRSLAYVAVAAERGLPDDLDVRVRESAAQRLAEWHSQAAVAFLDSYLSAAQGISSLPGKQQDTDKLLQFFLLEKALYEVAYEQANRPDWVTVPLQGVLDLLRSAPGAAQ